MGARSRRTRKQKGLVEAKPLMFLVARGGIEPPAQGFSTVASKGFAVGGRTAGRWQWGPLG
jgi:hypothetical protein